MLILAIYFCRFLVAKEVTSREESWDKFKLRSDDPIGRIFYNNFVSCTKATCICHCTYTSIIYIWKVLVDDFFIAHIDKGNQFCKD